jgi:hypothetical protein
VTCIAVYLKDICSSGERRRREQRRERLHCYAAKTDRRTMSQGSSISQICLAASYTFLSKETPLIWLSTDIHLYQSEDWHCVIFIASKMHVAFILQAI